MIVSNNVNSHLNRTYCYLPLNSSRTIERASFVKYFFFVPPPHLPSISTLKTILLSPYSLPKLTAGCQVSFTVALLIAKTADRQKSN